MYTYTGVLVASPSLIAEGTLRSAVADQPS